MDTIEPTGRLIGFAPDARAAAALDDGSSFHAVAAEVYDLPTYAASRSRSLAREYAPEPGQPDSLASAGDAADRLYAEIAGRFMREAASSSTVVLRLHNPHNLPFNDHPFDDGPDVA